MQAMVWVFFTAFQKGFGSVRDHSFAKGQMELKAGAGCPTIAIYR